MGILERNLKHIVAATLVAACFSAVLAIPATAQEADSTDPVDLLERLSTADPQEAKRIDRQLRAVWSKSGSAAMDLLLKRGRDAMEVGDTTAAIEHFTALTDNAPGFAEGWTSRAAAYFAVELFGPAVADLERALSLNPHDYNAIFGLASILETFDDKQSAYEAYRRVQSIHPNHEDVAPALERLRPQVEGAAL